MTGCSTLPKTPRSGSFEGIRGERAWHCLSGRGGDNPAAGRGRGYRAGAGKGKRGFDGASAYEIAQNNGFTGTEAEWLESLKGKFNSNVGNIRLINITGRLTSEPGVIIDFRTTRLRGVRDPQADDDAATRRYVDRAVTGYTVPSYWQEAVDAAAAKVTAKQDAGGMDCVTFALFSDVHAVPDSTTPNSGNTGNLTAAVMDACGVPFAVCCGDVCRTDADTETAARESIAAGQKSASHRRTQALQAQGDHDGSYGTAQMSAGAMFGAIFRSQAEDERRHFGGDGLLFMWMIRRRKCG